VFKVYGHAIHPIRTYHPNEWPQVRVYLREELRRAAPTLVGKPLGVDHLYDLPPPNRVTYAAWDDEADALYFEGEVSAEVAELIRSGRVRGVSIELNWERPGGRLEYVNGIAPRNFEFTGLDLIVNLEPGDPKAWVQLWEEAISALSRGGAGGWEDPGLKPSGSTPDGSEARKGGEKSEMAQTETVEGAVGFEETPTAPMEREWDADAAERRIRRWASKDGSGAKDTIDWAKYRRAFAWYDPEHADDFSGYKLPHHDVVNDRLVVVWRGVVAAMQALMGARGGVDIPAQDRRAVYEHLAGHYRQFSREPPEYHEVLLMGLEERVRKQADVLHEVVGQVRGLEEALHRLGGPARNVNGRPEADGSEAPGTDEAVRLREEIARLEGELERARRKVEEWRVRHRAFREAVLSLIPRERVWKRWGWGPQQFIYQLRRILAKES